MPTTQSGGVTYGIGSARRRFFPFITSCRRCRGPRATGSDPQSRL